MKKRSKISSKMYKHLRNKKCNKKCATFMWYFLESDLCLRTLFQFGLTIAPIQNSGLI